MGEIIQFLTNPYVVLVMLPIISLLFVGALFSSGVNTSGIIAVTLVLTFFIGHIIAGYATFGLLLLFVAGFICMLVELVVPGMIIGITGLVLIVISFLYAGANFTFMAYAVAIALILAIIGMVVMMKFFGKKLSVLNRMVLFDSTDTESGYVSNINRTELLQQTARTVTALRPSGVVMYNGERIDVVSEGNFIDADKEVIFVKVEGSRIVVREKKD